MSFYHSPSVNVGIDQCVCLSDGTSIGINWFEAYPKIPTNFIVYNIYYSTDKRTVFTDGPKFVSTTDDLAANIIDLIPGQDYYFSVRPLECDAITFAVISSMPAGHDHLKTYPQTFLSANINSSQLTYPLLDSSQFPGVGILKIGAELIHYTSNNVGTSTISSSVLPDRGFQNTSARSHQTDGYDGYHFQSPYVQFYVPGEDKIYDRIYLCQSRFEYPNFPGLVDGYHQVTKDILATDLEVSDAQNVGFKSYDYSGYHRTDPVALITGECLGSYIGGEQNCLDGYGVGRVVRGMNLQEVNNQRQEELLSTTGRPAVLIQRSRTGITCACYSASSEYADDRCPLCHGNKYVFGYQQYFNPRRSDGRIMVRVSQVDESLKVYDSGMESELPADMWTLTVPTIYMRDIIVLFDLAGNEEYRYEVAAVTRNNTFVGMEGAQKFRTTRIRKTDPGYQIRIFRDTSKFPVKMNTNIGTAPGLLPHTHEIVTNEGLPSGFSQTTSVSQGHNHPVAYISNVLTVLPAVGHTHVIVL
jgi:hypothetical protein